MLKNNGMSKLRCNHIVINNGISRLRYNNIVMLENNRIGYLECNFIGYVKLIDHLRNRSNLLNC